MVGESNSNVFMIQIDASSFIKFEISEFEITRFDCIKQKLFDVNNDFYFKRKRTKKILLSMQRVEILHLEIKFEHRILLHCHTYEVTSIFSSTLTDCGRLRNVGADKSLRTVTITVAVPVKVFTPCRLEA